MRTPTPVLWIIIIIIAAVWALLFAPGYIR